MNKRNHHTAQLQNARSQKNTIYRISLLYGVVSQNFFGTNFERKREPPKITLGSSTHLHAESSFHTEHLYLVLLLFVEWAVFRVVLPTLPIYTLLLGFCRCFLMSHRRSLTIFLPSVYNPDNVFYLHVFLILSIQVIYDDAYQTTLVQPT